MKRKSEQTANATSRSNAPENSIALTFYLVFVGGLFVAHLDVYLSLNGMLPTSIPVVFIISVAPVAFYIWSGPEASRRQEKCISALLVNGWPLFFLLMWAAASVILLARVVLPFGPEYSNLTMISQMPILLVGIVLGALPGARHGLRWALALAILSLGASVLYDSFFPGTFSTINTRPAGFAVNANAAALVLTMALAMMLEYSRVNITDVCMLVFVVIAVIITLSRGGLLLLFLLAVIYMMSIQYRSSVFRRMFILILTVGSIVMALPLVEVVIKETALADDPTVRQRLDQLLFKESFVPDDESRLGDFDSFLAMAVQRPFLGYGPGFSMTDRGGLEQGPHNMYLRALVDLGILGLVAYLGLLGSGLWLFWHRRFIPGIAFLLVVGVGGVFSHNIIENKAFLLLFGMGLGISADWGVRIGRGG